MLGILKKNEAGYIRGVIDHLAEDTKCGSTTRQDKEKENRAGAGNAPVEQQQQSQNGQISGGDVGLLLETHKDYDDQCSGNNVVTLQKRQRRQKRSQCI